MRTLLLMRGIPASGKSTFIKENKLVPYTLEADKFRLLVANPVLNIDGDFEISQKNDKLAWKMLFECLEERMKKGDFTVIDATHVTKEAMNRYAELASEYKYTIYYYEMDTDYEKCLEYNKNREEHKRVSEKIMKKMYNSLMNCNISNKFKKISNINEIINFYIDNVTEKYEKIKIIGDVHSCYTALCEIIKDFNEKTLYIFLGDYLDKGIEHKETFEKMLYLSNFKNVILLEGNHEIFLKEYGYSQEVKNVKFNERTLPALKELYKNEDELKKNLRVFWKKLRQCYAFEFYNYKILCNHGGLSSVPNMTLIPTSQMITGVGDYETEIGEIYEENYILGKCQNFIQIHGHRGVNSTEYSICLEGEVESGGELKCVEITKDSMNFINVVNNVYNKNYLQEELEKLKNREKSDIILTYDDEINKLILKKLINVKDVEPNLYSLNFTRNAFRKKLWNESTIKARGLFVDRETGDVKIRSYNKFFNYNENKLSSKKYLQENLKYPVNVYEKYNGFLGILSVINDEFVFATKSVTTGIHAKYFSNLFEKVSEVTKNKIFEMCKNEDVSLIFEVVCNEDRHIVDYFTKENLFLLDIVDNQLHINGVHIDINKSNELMEKLNIEDDILKVKKLVAKCNNFEEIENTMENYNKLKNSEGLVFCDVNGFMFKYKLEHYKIWKKRRNLLEKYKKSIENYKKFSIKDVDKENIEFAKWLFELNKDEILEKHIIDLMNIYELEITR